MKVRGIRGATTVDIDQADDILQATTELLQLMIKRNRLEVDDLAAVVFTVTSDIQAVYPAQAAREMGWTQVALLGAAEMNVPEGLPHCIRVLMLVNTELPTHELVHVYLRKAAQLRNDLA